VLAAAWPSLDGLGASEVEADMTELCWEKWISIDLRTAGFRWKGYGRAYV
jgi:hypothetical protein